MKMVGPVLNTGKARFITPGVRPRPDMKPMPSNDSISEGAEHLIELADKLLTAYLERETGA